jgi:hypothetical protein
MNFVKSGGGPLICLGSDMSSDWLGVSGNSEPKEVEPGCANDYERACRVRDYLGKLTLCGREVLILGDMPLETRILTRLNAPPMIVRVFYADQETDVLNVLQTHKELDFADSLETLQYQNSSSSLVVFDSAYPGKDASVERLSFELPVGPYLVLTKQFDPDERTSLLVHAFEMAN